MLSKWLKESNYTVVLTGAGMSTESGLPDFRSSGKGLWTKKDPSQIATTEALNQNVEEFFQFYRHRVLGLNEAKYHRGHEILANWEREGRIQSIITQNIDGFHTDAGSKNVIELHGTMKKVHCQTCGREYGNERYANEQFICDCGGKLRPSVVLFGEMLPEDALIQATEESEKADLFIVLGSSLSVKPANQFPLIAKQHGAKLVIMNLEPTELDVYADLVIHKRKIGAVLTEMETFLDT
ncbi:NAD-dependent deacylase [Lederbergia galactosidilytica]|uniref:NAD-dependent protein deacetylase n=1 Tax=Lederbergia galactosidilytica TaxID=217031 RepID=A0A177ZST2_9BACI|nr:NAD-dependent deacylase [Lederbergia galactosidilytica]OAK70977.1 NAD-dependent deacetylase [Lederbergia galactosidilytica]